MKKMFCPVCKSELVVTGQKRLETLVEHVECREPSLKDSYECSNPDCVSHFYLMHWDQDGEFYTDTYDVSDDWFIDKNNAPFGSFQRKLNVEVWKHDEDFYFPKIFGWTLKVEWKYKSNENGDILKKWIKLQLINPNNCYHIPGIKMFFYVISKKQYTWEHEDSPLRMGKEWWRYAATWFIYVFDRKRYLSWSKK